MDTRAEEMDWKRDVASVLQLLLYLFGCTVAASSSLSHSSVKLQHWLWFIRVEFIAVVKIVSKMGEKWM